MPNDDKRLLDYFIRHTDQRFAHTSKQIATMHESLSAQLQQQHNSVLRRVNRLRSFGIAVVFICVGMSPKGEKLLNQIEKMLPKILEIAAAAGERHE